MGLPILIHHNADRVGDNDGGWSYSREVADVLERYPKLLVVWVHAGVSRRCSEPNHYEMIDQMMSDCEPTDLARHAAPFCNPATCY